jgi:hypothetical protein
MKRLPVRGFRICGQNAVLHQIRKAARPGLVCVPAQIYAKVAGLGLAIEIVACFGTWIAMQPPARGSTGANNNRPSEAAAKTERFEASAPKSPKGHRLTREEVLSDLMLRAATGRTFPSQDEAARHYSVSPSRFSEWSKDWETEGSLPKRRMIGRCKVLAD